MLSAMCVGYKANYADVREFTTTVGREFTTTVGRVYDIYILLI